MFDARLSPTSRKVEDEVKAEKRRVCSTLNLNLDLSLLKMLCTAVLYFRANVVPGRLAMETGGFWGMIAACPKPVLGLPYSFVRLPPLSRGVSSYSIETALVLRFWWSCFTYMPATAPDARRSSPPLGRPIWEGSRLFSTAPPSIVPAQEGDCSDRFQ